MRRSTRWKWGSSSPPAAIGSAASWRGSRSASISARGLSRLLWKPMEALISQAAVGGGDEPLLALANFLFAQHRDAEAEAQLRRLVRPTEGPLLRAAAALRMSSILRQQNLLEPARRAAEE